MVLFLLLVVIFSFRHAQRRLLPPRPPPQASLALVWLPCGLKRGGNWDEKEGDWSGVVLAVRL